MAKQRLYTERWAARTAKERYITSVRVAPAMLKLFAPVLLYVTDAVYRGMFAEGGGR